MKEVYRGKGSRRKTGERERGDEQGMRGENARAKIVNKENWETDDGMWSKL